MNLLTKTTSLAMEITLQYIKEGDYVIDGTCGNGHDTYCLARAVGPRGVVLAIDIQEAALQSTKELLGAHDINNVVLTHGNFKELMTHSEKVSPQRKPSAIVFNLGYLPGGDKALITQTEDSLQAIKAALELVDEGGIVTAVLYSGHEAGAKEKEAILHMVEELPAKKYHVVYTKMMNQKKNPPEVLWITKKKGRDTDGQ